MSLADELDSEVYYLCEPSCGKEEKEKDKEVDFIIDRGGDDRLIHQ